MHRVGVVGVGAIGTLLAHGFNDLGHTVTVNDTDPTQTRDLPYDAHSKHELAAITDLLVIALPTPTTETGGDYSIIDDALHELTPTDATILIRSTMPPGSTRELADYHNHPLVYSPEFLRDRSNVTEFFTPDRIVLAGPRSERRFVREIVTHPDINECPVIETSEYLTAELGKYAHNAFFATKVSFANQMRVIADATGADVETVMDIVVTDSRNTTSHLDPRLGAFGGKCLPKDLHALLAYAERHTTITDLLRGVDEINEHAKTRYEYRDIEGRWPNIQVTPSGDREDPNDVVPPPSGD